MLLNLALLATGIAGVYSQSTFTVQVGPSGSLVYDPPTVSAMVGDTVRYCFNPKNHSVTSANFATPCQPNGVFDSGLTPVAEGSPEDCAQHFDITVPDENPIWLYCKQTNGAHCEHGMVGAINAPLQGKTFAAFQAAAEALLNATTTTAAPPVVTPPPSSDTDAPPAGAAATHTITVGANGQNMFTPPNITAQQGDQVVFLFLLGNHTSTQSTFDHPCEPLQESTGVDGIDSDFKPINPSNPNPVTFNITVKDKNPMFGYCRQTGHCQKGMVWSINADTSGNETFDNFLANALALAPPNSTVTGSAPAGSSTGSLTGSLTGSSTGNSTGNSNTSGALSTSRVSPVMIGLVAIVMLMF